MQYHVDVTNSTSTALDKGEYLHNNHQSSIIAYSDKSGALLSSNAYDVYGIPASSNSGRFGYTGSDWGSSCLLHNTLDQSLNSRPKQKNN
jgi:hypothetical protein